MDNNIKELLKDCKESMQWIVGSEFWEQMKEVLLKKPTCNFSFISRERLK